MVQGKGKAAHRPSGLFAIWGLLVSTGMRGTELITMQIAH